MKNLINKSKKKTYRQQEKKENVEEKRGTVLA